MDYKKFKDYPQLIEVLKTRNLIIDNDLEAIEILKTIHYYRLSAYFIPFYASTDYFKENTSFKDIVCLYKFDENLRKMLLKYLGELEIILRAQISHIHAKKYGAFGYIEDIDSLRRDIGTAIEHSLFDEFMKQANKEKARANEDFIRHLKNKYNIDDLPIWALVEIISFGSLSKFFKLMHKDEKIEILKFFRIDTIRLNVFENWLESLSYIRNVCAHHSRIHNRTLAKSFKRPRNLLYFCDNIRTDKVFFAVNVLVYILNNKKIKQDFTDILETYPLDINTMGIPNNWQNLALWH